MNLIGKVKSGHGNASIWVEKASKIFKEKYGKDLYFGTLNIELDEKYILNSEDKILPEQYGGEYDVFVKKAKIMEDEVYILRPQINNVEGGHHSLKIIEIVSDVNLRKKYGLQDGDKVMVYLK